MQIGKRIWNFLITFQKVILIFSSLIIFISLVISVLLRYVFKIDFYGIEEILLIPTIWLYFIGSSYGSYENSHISADFTENFISNERVKYWLDATKLVLVFFATITFTFWTGEYLIWSIENAGATTGWQIPKFLYHVPIFTAFCLMTFYAFYHLIRHFTALFGIKREEV